MHFFPSRSPCNPLASSHALSEMPAGHAVFSLQVTPLVTCTWSNCGYTWCESADQRVAGQDRPDFQ